MATYVVELQYSVDRAGRDAVHPAHADHLLGLAETGTLLLAGPLVDSNGGLLVLEVADRAALDQILDNEPYARAGFVSHRRVQQWQPGKGSLLRARVTGGTST